MNTKRPQRCPNRRESLQDERRRTFGGDPVKIARASCLALTALTLTFTGVNRAAAQASADVLPPHQIMTSVRSAGIQPVGGPRFRGTIYVLQGYDDSDELVRVVVDARTGRLLSIRPILAVAPSYAQFPLSVREPFGPRAVYGGRYDEFAPFPRGPTTRPPGAVDGGPRPPAVSKPTASKPGQTPLPPGKPT